MQKYTGYIMKFFYYYFKTHGNPLVWKPSFSKAVKRVSGFLALKT